MRYPILVPGATIGVTAPSSGVPSNLHELIQLACKRMEKKGYTVNCGDTVWTQFKAKSAPAKQRADEFNSMMSDDSIDIIVPPWGGELLIEILEHVDFDAIQEKWVLGYSDTSTLLLAITLKTGIATAHGTNLVDLRGKYLDNTTAMWEAVLSTEMGESIFQYSSEKYQKKWQYDNPTPWIYHLTEETRWQSTEKNGVHVQGRLLGGCIDVIRHLVGTPFGDVSGFRKRFTNGEPILWYLENAELNTADLRRSLVQMKLAGWFEQCSAVMFGRSSANQVVNGYTVQDVYQELFEELQIPIIYNIDCGHVPPQITFINGALATVEVTEDGKGMVIQHFC
jgi:muramoyltetrapeptide carboxypeptidase LdcA involved in peptidoglycan recycling